MMDMSPNKTYNKKGETFIEMKTTTGTKTRSTVLLANTSEGVLLPPFIIYKTRQVKVSNAFEDYCLVKANSNGWITES